MILSQYNIILKRLEIQDLETVRHWRNDDSIRLTMFYQQLISEEMQKQWFESINNVHHHYFLIFYKNEAIGLTHVSHLDFNKKTGEVGLFVYDKRYINTDVPARASLCLLNYFFGNEYVKSLYAKVKISNQEALAYNQMLGFNIVKNTEDSGYLLCVTKEEYEIKVHRIKQWLKRSELQVTYIPNFSIDEEWQNIYSK